VITGSRCFTGWRPRGCSACWDLGWDYYERERDTARQVSRHVGKLAGLGYDVTVRKRPGPGPGHPGRLTRPAPQPTAQTASGCPSFERGPAEAR
jgi:hypothetical protein